MLNTFKSAMSSWLRSADDPRLNLPPYTASVVRMRCRCFRDSLRSSLFRNRDDFMLPQQHAGERGRAPSEMVRSTELRVQAMGREPTACSLAAVPACARLRHPLLATFVLRCGPLERCDVHSCSTRWTSMRRAAKHRECRGCGQAGPTLSSRRCLCPEPERGQPRQPRADVGQHRANAC